MKKLFALLFAVVMIAAMIPLAASADCCPDCSRGIICDAHVHVYKHDRYNLKYHWKQCVCGQKISMEPHMDPKDADNDYCTCGFHFSDNADLVVLWASDCEEIGFFNKNKTEYTVKAYTYKDVEEVKITAKAFDVQSTIEIPEDLTLKEGENKIPVKVTSGNQKVTKTYTLTIVKEAK